MNSRFHIITVLLFIVHYDEVEAEACYLDTTSCINVTSTMCLTAKITFTHTSLQFTNSASLASVERDLEIWSALRRVPECWAVIQPFLCSVYMPRCYPDQQKVEVPNRELCERIRSPCEVVMRSTGSWPTFLQCNSDFYAERCGLTYFETSNFDTVGECSPPLIQTADETTWYDQIKGCGVDCTNPMYTEEEHNAAHIVVAILGSLCLACTTFTLLTFIIDWKVGRKYPAVILFFINICFFIASLGWMSQFVARDEIVCRKDGTVRKEEPRIGTGESASCTIVFIVIYYFMMAGVVWFVMLAYSWDVTFKALGTVRDDLSKKTSYFHIISWCLPLVLTIVLLSISEIDGDSLSGICFPGYFDSWVRAGFVVAPIVVAIVVGMVFSIRGLRTLLGVRKNTPQFISDRATAKIKETVVRLGIFIVMTLVLVLITLSVHIYTFTSEGSWQDSFKQYAYCQANISVMQMLDNGTTSSCMIDSRPSIFAAIIHVFAFFCGGIAMSSWSWTKASLEAWERLFRRICNKPVNKPQKLHKHRMVARAMKRRKQRMNERLSVSYGTDHDDPVGMKFDMNSMSSQSLSSGFAVAMPKHGRHRGRMMYPTRAMRRRRSESDASSLSRSHRPSSRSSRRQSYESSMSQKLSDIERDIREEERRKRRVKRRKKRQNRIQPILEPISSTVAAMQGLGGRHRHGRHRHRSDSSDISKTSAQNIQVGMDAKAFNQNNRSMGSSNVLSESMTTANSISELELPQLQPKMPDFSIFTANTMLPPCDNKADKGDNPNGNNTNTTSLKGAKSSPSGSFRRGRRREVKLEMTETSFYQEDDDMIEMGGNQTIHTQENCHESGEIRQNLKELGPLVSEMFEQARTNSASGRTSGNGRSSGQTDVMGSSRLGSASSRGSKGSRGSQSIPKDHLKYANTKVKLPERTAAELKKSANRRPFSGDYVLTSKRNSAKRDMPTRKSQSQPGSRVSSANTGRGFSVTDHKRQIGHNGRIGFDHGLNWSRFLQGKGHVPGQMFMQPQNYDKSYVLNQDHLCGQGHGLYVGHCGMWDQSHMLRQGQMLGQGQMPGQVQMPGQEHMLGQYQLMSEGQMLGKGRVPGQLQIMDKKAAESQIQGDVLGAENGDGTRIAADDEEFTGPTSTVNNLDMQKQKQSNENDYPKSAENELKKNADVLCVKEMQNQNHFERTCSPVAHKTGNIRNRDILKVEKEQEHAHNDKDRLAKENQEVLSPKLEVNVLNIEEEHKQCCDPENSSQHMGDSLRHHNSVTAGDEMHKNGTDIRSKQRKTGKQNVSPDNHSKPEVNKNIDVLNFEGSCELPEIQRPVTHAGSNTDERPVTHAGSKTEDDVEPNEISVPGLNILNIEEEQKRILKERRAYLRENRRLEKKGLNDEQHKQSHSQNHYSHMNSNNIEKATDQQLIGKDKQNSEQVQPPHGHSNPNSQQAYADQKQTILAHTHPKLAKQANSKQQTSQTNSKQKQPTHLQTVETESEDKHTNANPEKVLKKQAQSKHALSRKYDEKQTLQTKSEQLQNSRSHVKLNAPNNNELDADSDSENEAASEKAKQTLREEIDKKLMEAEKKHLLHHRPLHGMGASTSSWSKTSVGNSGSSRNSGQARVNGRKTESEAESRRAESRKHNKQLDNITVLPGVAGRDMFSYGDDDDDEDDDDEDYDLNTDDLTDTYTYTSYDDDLTEVSSLPC